MKIGFSEQIITPALGIEMVGYIPSRRAESIEKDLTLKVTSLEDDRKYYVWLTVDMLGLDNYFKEVLLEKLENDHIHIDDLQMFSTHTHSGPICLNKEQYLGTQQTESKSMFINDEDTLNKEFFDLLVKQGYNAIKESINDLEEFTYRIARGKMKDFQTNRIDQSFYSFNDILTIEITKNNKKSLLYSFSGHPTILNSASTRISPDYIGEVSKNLSKKYPFNQFFNSPCGDMSTRYTKVDSTLEELQRLGKIAADHVLDTLNHLSEPKVLNTINYENTEYRLNYKKFLDLETAQKLYDESKKAYDIALRDNLEPLQLRSLRATLEGHMVNLYHSKQNYSSDHYMMQIGVVRFDDFTVINLESEIFSSLIEPIVQDSLWINSLSGQYSTYLTDARGFELNTYESLSSLYEINEGENLIQYLKEII